MNYATPEKHGISSADIEAYIKILEEKKLSTHNLIIARDDDIVFEGYWKPFEQDFLHRMYSVTKSIVAIAVGFAEQDGLLTLDDTMEMHFPSELEGQTDENMRKQTIRNMLNMCTAKLERSWFAMKPEDRVRFYFENDKPDSRPAGTIFQYDSTGTFVLCALVERLTGKTFVEYMKEKLFDKLGISDETYCLKCPGGHSWGDSALLMKPKDMMLIVKFLMNKGKWCGEQILNEKFATDAISSLVDNNALGIENFNTYGYGYYIWRTYDNGFLFNGMGCQLFIGLPDQGIMFGYNGDNQGNVEAKNIIIDNFFNMVSRRAKDEPLPENPEAHKSLTEYAKTLELFAVRGDAHSTMQDKINGKTFKLAANPTGITEIKLSFGEDTCQLYYVNSRGEKTIDFGMTKNVFGIFPEEGYSKDVGTKRAPGNYYKCASSAAWVTPTKLFLRVQIIDTYFGILNMNFVFKDENTVGVFINKTAEDFLYGYQGYADGRA